MATKLSSLKVTADLDTSGYVRAAQAKVAADRAMDQSSQSVGASLAQADARLAKAIPGVAQLSRQYLAGYQSAARFEAAIRQVGGAVDRGMDLQRASEMLSTISQKFGLVANSADLMKAGFQSIVPIVDSLNAKLAAQAEIAQRAAAAQAMTTRQTGFQSTINDRLGVRTDFGTEARAADIAAYGQEIDSLVKRFAPLRAATEAYESDVLELNRALSVGAITAEEYGHAQIMLQQRLAQRQAAYMPAAAPVAPGKQALSSQELANISYQLNDIAVMAASGQSPFILLTQQGMQLSQLLGPRGLGGAVRALGTGLLTFLFNPLNLAVMGFAAVTGAAVHFFNTMGSNSPKIEDLLEVQRDLIRDMGKAWGEAAIQASKYETESGDALRLRGRIAAADLGAALRSEAVGALQEMDSPYARGPVGRFGTPQGLSTIDQAVVRLRETMRTGQPDILAFRAELEAIADDPSASIELLRQASAMLELTKNAGAAQSALDQVNEALDYQAPDRRMTEFQGQRSYNLQRDRELSQLGIGHQIDIDAITAKSPSQRADIAARREEASLLNEVIDGTVALQRIENARQVAYAQAQYEINQGNRERILSGDQAIAGAKLEVELIGKTAGETALLRANFQAYWDLRRQAEQNGLVFDEKLYQLLQKQNAELARQAQLLAERKLTDDILFERSQIGLSSQEQGYNTRLRGAGIDPASDLGEQYKAQMRLNDITKDFADIQAGVLRDFAAGMRAGASATEAAIDALTRMGDKLMDMAMDQAINAIFGGQSGQGGGGLVASLLSGVSSLIGAGGGMSGGGDAITMSGLYATGGNAVPGQVYRVNENGLEYFQPHVPGRILPAGSFQGLDQLAAQARPTSWDGMRQPAPQPYKVIINNSNGDNNVQATTNDDLRQLEIFVDRRQARNAGDPYSAYSKVTGSKGMRPRLRER